MNNFEMFMDKLSGTSDFFKAGKHIFSMGDNAKVPFPLSPPTDLIARANFSSLLLRNAHGRKNLLSFLAIQIRVFLIDACADVWRRNGDFYD